MRLAAIESSLSEEKENISTAENSMFEREEHEEARLKSQSDRLLAAYREERETIA